MITIDKNKCTGCMACKAVCPKNAISIVNDELFSYPNIQHKLCVNCGKCNFVCPVESNLIHTTPKYSYIGYVNDISILDITTTSGIATFISTKFIYDGGIVYGLKFSCDYQDVVYHRGTTIADVNSFAGSKYFENKNDSSIFNQVKNDVEANKKVLFIGRGCYIKALKKFLSKEYENLFTIEIACNSIASSVVWKKYMHYLELMHDKTRRVFFRKNGKFIVEFINGEYIDCDYKVSPFFVEFLTNDKIIRPSCLNCVCKFPNSNADMTIGDAWGVYGKYFKQQGTKFNFMICNDKANSLLHKYSNDITYQKIDIEQLKNNGGIYKSRSHILN